MISLDVRTQALVIIFIIIMWGRGVYGERSLFVKPRPHSEIQGRKSSAQEAPGTLEKHQGLCSVYLQPLATASNNVIPHVMMSKRHF